MKKVLVPRVRFKGFDDNWEQGNIGEVFELTRGEVLSRRKIRNKKMGEYIYPVFSSQTLNNGLLGFYNNFLFKNSITWTTDGANAGTVLYRDGLFYATNVCGVMLQKTSIKPSSYFAHEINVKVKKHVIKAGNPKLMINVLHEVLINFSKNKLEQEKISILIENIDNLITLEEIKHNKLKQLKETLLQKMFPEGNSKKPRIRFRGFDEEWKEEKLEEIGQTYTGLSGKTKKDFGHGNSRYITYLNIFNNPIANLKGLDRIEEDCKQNSVKYGDIFVTTSSEIREEVGMTSIWPFKGKENIYLNSFCFGIRLNNINNYDINFLAYNLRNNELRKDIVLLAQGISRFNISNRRFMKLNILLPNFSEQQKIGDFFSKIDTLLDLYQSKLNKLRQIKEALLQKMFV
ncbi:restriction endonuclease subunit S [Mycoplasmopsis felis]|uniref:restriction endonuclease subunit S n=2 Tax=Mycoplasmopsis felis TaxID=33923 RepID=UPI002AFFA5B9|nr:restriction endonuclease subunit S [Mycoplasmopsis felis]WQQ08798.1 restriction endonuclease subunit S [Mycoplasmopsis felis]